MGVLDQILLQGDDSMLRDALVQKRGMTSEVGGGINLLGNMFNYNGPMLWMGYLFHDSHVPADSIMAVVDSVINRVSTSPIDQATVDRALVKFRSGFLDMTTDLFGFGRADLLASFALFYDDPAKINSIEEQIKEVTPELIQRTAKEYLRPGSKTVLSLVPKSGS
jgi:predicted Zn-dependent peptidase